MASITMNNAGVGNLFKGIAGLLAGPDPASLIEADYKRTQRDNVLSDTAINNSKLQTLQRQEQAMSELAQVLGDPTLSSTPEGRAKLMSVLSQVPDGLKDGPGFATGASVFTDPNVFNPNDLSNVAFATGVAPNYANTPSGLSQTLSGEMDRALLKEQGDTFRKVLDVNAPNGGSKGVPPVVNFNDTADFTNAIESAVTSQFDGLNMDPALREQMVARATQLFQQSRNAPLAVQQALAEFDLHQGPPGEMQPWWNPFRMVIPTEPPVIEGQRKAGLTDTSGAPGAGGGSLADMLSGILSGGGNTGLTGGNVNIAELLGLPAEAPTGQAQAQAPGAIAADAPMAAQPPGAVPPDQLPTLAKSVIQRPDGSFELVVNGKAMVLENGQTIVNKTTGATLVWKDGQWFQAQ